MDYGFVKAFLQKRVCDFSFKLKIKKMAQKGLTCLLRSQNTSTSSILIKFASRRRNYQKSFAISTGNSGNYRSHR